MPNRAIKAIFFTRFHHEKGSRVLHQVPEGSITPCSSPSSLPAPLITFSSITSYLIPNQQFCDRLLTFCTNHYRVIGYPVCIREEQGKVKYERNEFIFNLALVVDEGLRDWVAFGEVVRKLGRLLRGLEEQGGLLSGEEQRGAWEGEGDGMGGAGCRPLTGEGAREVWSGLQDADADAYTDGAWRFGVGGGSKVYALCENVLEDLNNYAECMIPIDDSNTINLKLFPTRPPPPPIHTHTVPLLTISLSTLSRPLSSDLTLARILPHINGINSVSHIAQLADTDLSLTRKAIQHLVYYSCLVLLDVFSFGAIYAPTAEIGGFVVDAEVGMECARYVCTRSMRWGHTSTPRISSSSSPPREDRLSISSSTNSDAFSPTSRSGSGSNSTTTIPNNPSVSAPDDDAPTIPHDTLITLYTSLRQGLTLRNWVLENLDLLSGIDVRRFITFGIIKGFLYRVHKYALATSISIPPAPPTSLQSAAPSTAPSTAGYKDSDQATLRGGHQPPPSHSHLQHKPSLASTTVFGTGTGAGSALGLGGAKENASERHVSAFEALEHGEREQGLPLVRFLDGMHCFDEICVELGLSEGVVEGKVKGVGEVVVFAK
ncbi:nitrogen permease regulator 2 [Byssothecium circinans]|uniref:Nitrogen permease regulator 2 n=1 Tax=Byssothecium circinans TaxID=147558 RepID=A0A6A5TSM1_9PLEO|nr:nitrogen permease regulator 2 [Byssothecium circinans]